LPTRKDWSGCAGPVAWRGDSISARVEDMKDHNVVSALIKEAMDPFRRMSRAACHRERFVEIGK
jgi:hypothetical protein